MQSTLTFQNLTDNPLRFDFESQMNMFAPDLPFRVSATTRIELIDGLHGQMTDGTASLTPPPDFVAAGVDLVRPGLGTSSGFQFSFPPELNMGASICRLYTSGRDLEEISPTLAHDLLAVLTRIQPAKMT